MVSWTNSTYKHPKKLCTVRENTNMQYIFYANTARTKGCAIQFYVTILLSNVSGIKICQKGQASFLFFGKELEHATANNIGNKTILRPIGNMGKIADYQFVLDTQ